MQTKAAKRVAAIARNEKHRAKYEAQAKEKGLTEADAIQSFVEHKIGIPA
jgi:acyl-CoA-binding protein